jgi:hypothetical protein
MKLTLLDIQRNLDYAPSPNSVYYCKIVFFCAHLKN